MTILSMEEYAGHLETYCRNLDDIWKEIETSVEGHVMAGKLDCTKADLILNNASQSRFRRKEDALELEDYLNYLADTDTKGSYPCYEELVWDMCPLNHRVRDPEFSVFMIKCLPCHRDW